ncbi:MAG: hypothetical protein H0X37_14615 [Herpetosiphonaceae bacterium]|nr:hypothetical protein [Herpetosiphonaceae bacterium]
MTIRAIVFDTGGVLEITPITGWTGRDEIIFLDDFEPNVAAAREFGMHTILFQDTTQAIADIRACLQANAVAYK